jgi:hypothetical protein
MASKTQAEWLEEMKPGRVFACNKGDYRIVDAQPGPDENSVDVTVAEVDETLRFDLDEIVDIRD